MPIVTKGEFYIESYNIQSDDDGTPIVDVLIGHPDGYRIVLHIKPKSVHTARAEELIYVEIM